MHNLNHYAQRIHHTTIELLNLIDVSSLEYGSV